MVQHVIEQGVSILIEHVVFTRLILQVFYSAPLKVYKFAKGRFIGFKSYDRVVVLLE